GDAAVEVEQHTRMGDAGDGEWHGGSPVELYRHMTMSRQGLVDINPSNVSRCSCVTTLANLDRPSKVASRAPNRRAETDLLPEPRIAVAGPSLRAPAVEGLLSLRAVAREVGVVPQSVYLHFADRTQLVKAVIERRFGELTRATQAAEDSVSHAAAKLRARCL